MTNDELKARLAEAERKLDEAEQRAGKDEEDAEKWREHEKVMSAALIENTLYMRLSTYQHGKKWQIECVLDRGHLVGSLAAKAVSLAAELKYLELDAAIDDARRGEEGKK